MILRLSIFINAVFILFLFWYFCIHVGLGSYYQKYISPKETFFDDIYYKAKLDAYLRLNKLLEPNKEYDVFVGDSFVEQFPIKELLNRKNVLNRGIGFDTTAGVLKRLDLNINNINISKCFLWIGHNDLKYRTVDETWKNIIMLLNKIKTKEKYFISVLPCSDAEYNIKIKRLNNLVKASSERINFKYIDIYNFFEESSRDIKQKYYFDGVHLTVSGYLKMLTILKNEVSY